MYILKENRWKISGSRKIPGKSRALQKWKDRMAFMGALWVVKFWRVLNLKRNWYLSQQWHGMMGIMFSMSKMLTFWMTWNSWVCKQSCSQKSRQNVSQNCFFSWGFSLDPSSTGTIFSSKWSFFWEQTRRSKSLSLIFFSSMCFWNSSRQNNKTRTGPLFFCLLKIMAAKQKKTDEVPNPKETIRNGELPMHVRAFCQKMISPFTGAGKDWINNCPPWN